MAIYGNSPKMAIFVAGIAYFEVSGMAGIVLAMAGICPDIPHYGGKIDIIIGVWREIAYNVKI